MATTTPRSDPRLGAVIDAIEANGRAAELYDTEWRLALGDEVNECARIQQTARNGSLLASKPLIERLDPEKAQTLRLDPLTMDYHTVGELPGVTHKAVRDAGGVPVVHVPWAHDG
jgi:hypothetical protein